MKNKILPIATIAVVVIAAAVLFFPKGETIPEGSGAEAATINENGDLEISAEALSSDDAAIISYNSDGTDMELLAVKSDDGTINVAFNTCQVCNGSPKAYFVQKNGKLVCQNCGNKFSLSSVGASAMGCNPISISGDDVTETDLGILISREFLEANINLFNNWKKS